MVFFSDEVFQWVVNNGDDLPRPKYTAKEFEQISEKSKPLIDRLHVSPIALEKVAFVLMREDDICRKLTSESEQIKKDKKKSEHSNGSGVNVRTAASERRPRMPKPIIEKVTKKAHARKTPIKEVGQPAKSIAIPIKKDSDDEHEVASAAPAVGAGAGKKRGRPAKFTPGTSTTGTGKKRGRPSLTSRAAETPVEAEK